MTQDDEMNDLDAFLEGKPLKEEKRIIGELPKEIEITQNARKKQDDICDLVTRIGKQPFEWYGYLLGKMDDPHCVVRDVILASNQDVSRGHCEVNGEDVAKAAYEVRELNNEKGTNYQIIGWTHSHGGIPNPFHSGTDANNFMTVLNSVALNTQRLVPRSIECIISPDVLEERVLKTDGQERVVDVMMHDPQAAMALLEKYHITMPEGDDPVTFALRFVHDLMQTKPSYFHKKKTVGFAYSIVVNNQRQTHHEIALLEHDLVTQTRRQGAREIPLSVVKVEDDITYAEEDLAGEIKTKIQFPPPPPPVKPVKRGKWKVVEKVKDTVDRWAGRQSYLDSEEPARRKGWGQYVPPYETTGGKVQVIPPPKVLTLEEAARITAGKFMDYLHKEWDSDRHNADIIDAMLGNIMQGKSVQETVTEMGMLSSTPTKRNNWGSALQEAVAHALLSEVKEGREEKREEEKEEEKREGEKREREKGKEEGAQNLQDLLFAVARATNIPNLNAALEHYVTISQGKDPVIASFPKALFTYVQQWDVLVYNKWTNKMLCALKENPMGGLEGAIRRAGAPVRDAALPAKYAQHTYLSKEQVEYQRLIVASDLQPETVALLKRFVNTKWLSECTKILDRLYSTLTESARQAQEKAVDELLCQETKSMGERDNNDVIDAFLEKAKKYYSQNSGTYSRWMGYVLNHVKKASSLPEAVRRAGSEVEEIFVRHEGRTPEWVSSEAMPPTNAQLSRRPLFDDDADYKKMEDALKGMKHSSQALYFMIAFYEYSDSEDNMRDQPSSQLSQLIVRHTRAVLFPLKEEKKDVTKKDVTPEPARYGEQEEAEGLGEEAEGFGEKAEKQGEQASLHPSLPNQLHSLEDFASAFMDYAMKKSGRFAGKYALWTCTVLEALEATPDKSFATILHGKGTPIANEQTSGGYTAFTEAQKESIRTHLVEGSYSLRDLTFMDEFLTGSKAAALEGYVALLQEGTLKSDVIAAAPAAPAAYAVAEEHDELILPPEGDNGLDELLRRPVAASSHRDMQEDDMKADDMQKDDMQKDDMEDYVPSPVDPGTQMNNIQSLRAQVRGTLEKVRVQKTESHEPVVEPMVETTPAEQFYAKLCYLTKESHLARAILRQYSQASMEQRLAGNVPVTWYSNSPVVTLREIIAGMPVVEELNEPLLDDREVRHVAQLLPQEAWSEQEYALMNQFAKAMETQKKTGYSSDSPLRHYVLAMKKRHYILSMKKLPEVGNKGDDAIKELPGEPIEQTPGTAGGKS